ncbi:MAG TPA: SpoIID/LytB domain-containing protein [Candidatus Blautia merdigallinarum]|uniref:SpoIID/LytB domain-containing protein n=1 Tax=Candidatus Blautia merdigallinarum TaxID=2838495 RepID=A0A9D2N6S3_9FIRM|nr:SpoIID/LytB domain-containing protein [Candidatus Blautia merdigallinarum]
MRVLTFEKITYIGSMDWKEKMKWKILIILAALVGILIVWCAGKAGEEREIAESEILKEYALKENEWASAAETVSSLKDRIVELAEEKTAEIAAAAETAGQKNAGKEESQEVPIRVLIMDNGYNSYYHDRIFIEFQGTCQGNSGETFQAGDTLELTKDSARLGEGSYTLSPGEEKACMKVTSLSRGQGSPSYRGSLTVYKDENGLRLVNTLPLEEYLYGVVPSEMPASYPKEALKAQAVCARTYACVQMTNSSLEALGAQVDDSVSYQVYQNSGEAKEASQAVEETAGEILLNNGSPITAYYFSTSHGRTSTDQVWAASAPSSYLQSVECTYDSGEPWYQWEVELSLGKILENVQGMFEGVSSVAGIETGEEGTEGGVLKLVIHTDQGDKELHSEYDIRTALAPEGLSVTRQDGSQVMGTSLLPSAYFTLEESRDEQGDLTGYKILGGGYGHGVGMSQNGAKGMADTGKNYQEILKYFYKDVEIGNINDAVDTEDS